MDRTAALAASARITPADLADALPSGRLRLGVTLKVAAVLLIGLAEAWAGPPDRSLNVLTHGSALSRLILTGTLAAIGLAAASRIGLSLNPINTKRPLVVALALSLGVAAFCAVVDGLFKPILNRDYIQMLTTTPVGPRQILYSMRAIYESLVYRLFLGSVFAWMIGAVWRKRNGEIAEGAYIAGFTLAQLVNMGASMTSYMPLNDLTLAYYALRYFAPGVAWGLIYRRYGFLTNELAVGGVHFFFQPMVTAVLLLRP